VFDLLKKKISGFVGKLGGEKEEAAPTKEEKVEKKVEEPKKIKEVKKAAALEKKSEPKKETDSEEKKVAVEPKPVEKKAQKKEVPKKEPVPKKAAPESPKPKAEEKAAPVKEEVVEKVEEKVEVTTLPQEKKEEKPAPAAKVEEKPKEKKKGLFEKLLGKKEEKPEEPAPEKKEETVAKEVGERPKEKAEEVKPPEPVREKPKKEAPLEKEERIQKKEEELKKKVKKSLFSSVTETIRGESEIKEEEIEELLDELELGMLESDVALSVAEEIKEDLKKRIIGSKVKRGQTAIFVRDSLNEILLKMFNDTPGFDVVAAIKSKEKPVKIMVVGPNGAGKTTTIAKIVKMFQNNGLTVCVAASDTFRAAAVEQLVHHGNKLGIKVVHGAYGSDPTSIAFDAVNYAKANKLDVVLIDTAGRQETNVNLLNQLKKMDRVIAPDLKIYVGESIAGNAMVEQISRFNGDIGLNGVILTKLDCDAKGGTVISVSRVANLPILYVGVGQGYEDLKPFVAEEIVGEILS